MNYPLITVCCNKRQYYLYDIYMTHWSPQASVFIRLTIPTDPPLLVCPPLLPGSIGICVEQCSGDDDCPTGQKCCSNGCGHVCKVAVNATIPPVCHSGGRTFKVGQRFPAEDGCNTW